MDILEREVEIRGFRMRAADIAGAGDFIGTQHDCQR